jgi:hypothetical protein
MKQYASIDMKKAYNSVRREVLYSILIVFGLPMKLIKLIKMSLLFATCCLSLEILMLPSMSK